MMCVYKNYGTVDTTLVTDTYIIVVNASTVVQDAKLIIQPSISAVNQSVSFSVTMVMFTCILSTVVMLFIIYL